jgi:serine/threonine-protein kinase ULK/ATG1
VERSGEIDPDEGDILDLLEDTARKAFVLFDLADTRLFQWSQTVRPSATSATITPHTLAPSPGAPPFSIPPVGGRRKSSSSSTNSELIALRQQEDAAGDACALYFKSLAFICAGHERFKRYWEARKMRSVDYEISAELNESECYLRLQLGPC